MYKPINRRAVITALQGQNLPEIALAVPCSNDDRPDYFQRMRDGLADHAAHMQTVAEINLAIDNMPIMDRPVARAKLLHAIKNDLLPSRSQYQGNPIGPERRKTPRTAGRHGLTRLTISEQHRERLDAQTASTGKKSWYTTW
jgi:hypothetical protein